MLVSIFFCEGFGLFGVPLASTLNGDKNQRVNLTVNQMVDRIFDGLYGRFENRVSGALKFLQSHALGAYTNLNSFFENGKSYVLCKVVDDCKLAPGTRKMELFVLPYRNGF